MVEQPGKAVIVEFVGVPGAGKSTISRAVAERLGLEFAPSIVTEPSFVLFQRSGSAGLLQLHQAARLFVRHPGITAHWIQAIWSTDQDSFSDLLRMVLDVLSSIALLFRCSLGQRIHLFDQGLLQAVSSVLASSSGRIDDVALADDVERILARFEHIIIVFVDAEPQTLQRRLQERSGTQSRIELLADPADRLQAIERARHAVNKTGRIVEILQRRSAERFRVITVKNDGDGSQGSAVHAILRQLRRAMDA